MKKIFLMFVCFFSSMSLTLAISSEELNMYFKTEEGSIINMPKIYDEDTSEVLFSGDLENLEELDKNDYIIYYEKYLNDSLLSNITMDDLKKISTAIYFGYNENPTDLNYYYTQLYLYKKIFNLEVDACDALGSVNDINTYLEEINAKVDNYFNEKEEFLKEKQEVEIWDTNEFTFTRDIRLANPYVSGLTFDTKDPKKLVISNDTAGDYALYFETTNNSDLRMYKGSKKVLWQNNKGPARIEDCLLYTVKGTPFYISESVESSYGKFGDAKLNSTYEIYLNDELKLTTSNMSFMVKSNENYVIKDVSIPKGVRNTSSYSVFVGDEVSAILFVNKSVIIKGFYVMIDDDNTYEVYLKSNDELYEVIDKNTSFISLPYGTYYLKNNDGYYEEFSALDDGVGYIKIPKVEEVEEKDEVKDNSESTPNVGNSNANTNKSNSSTSTNTPSKNELKEEEANNEIQKEEVTKEEEVLPSSLIPDNPQTGDVINIYTTTLILCLTIFLCLIKKINVVVGKEVWQ